MCDSTFTVYYSVDFKKEWERYSLYISCNINKKEHHSDVLLVPKIATEKTETLIKFVHFYPRKKCTIVNSGTGT